MELTYMRDEGAESCPDEAWLKQQIAGHLGYDPFIEGHSDNAPVGRKVSCRLAKAHTGDEFVATLQTTEPNIGTVGRRELRSGPSCDALAASVVLSLSMAIDPIAAETARPAAPTITPPAPLPSAAIPASEPVHPLGWWLTSAGVVATGWQNTSASPIASLDLHVQRGQWSAFIEGRASASSSTLEPSLQTRLLLGGLGLCRARGAFYVCGAAVAGPLFVTASGVEEQRNIAALLAVGPRLSWSRSLAGPLLIEVGIEAYANVVRPRVLVDDVVTWRAAAGTAAVTLGLGWRLR